MNVRYSVESGGDLSWLEFNLDGDLEHAVSDSLDAALVALLIPAMDRGESMHLHGSVSERLLFNVQGPLQAILMIAMPWLRKVEVFADSIVRGRERPSGVATGFSGGVDSFSLIGSAFRRRDLMGFVPTVLLFNNVGSHGVGGDKLFAQRFGNLAPAAKGYGIPFIKINSNIGRFYFGRCDFESTHTLRNAAVALLLQGGVGRYLYASAYHLRDLRIGRVGDSAFIDPVLLPMLSTERIDMISVGGEWTRVQKTLQLVDMPESYRYLDVCVSPERRPGRKCCSECFKCLRTLATLEFAGKIEVYGDVFDLSVYRRRRIWFFAALLGSDDPFMRELREYARDSGYRLPASSIIMHHLMLVRVHDVFAALRRRARRFLSRALLMFR